MRFSSFSTKAKWQHCRGSSKNFRGYTCGLWSTFHALTVQAYLDNIKNATFQPLHILHSIQGWVDNFFGCRHCRDHFMEMTEKTFPMKTKAKKSVDAILYLWKAHNVVNARLKGDDTEDPEFPKYQFPPNFLCSNCSSKSGTFDEKSVMEFMLNYYTAIKPHSPSDKEDARATFTP
uniref:Sulfhydryl oxidase n=1 Tax=Plectus sambesii TaxID=2011161 RepID=A0A914VSH5_9BILA